MRQAAPTAGQTAPTRYGGNGQRRRPGRPGPVLACSCGTELQSKKWPGVGRASELPGELAGAGGTELAATRDAAWATGAGCTSRPVRPFSPACKAQGDATLGSTHRYSDRLATNRELEDAKCVLEGLSGAKPSRQAASRIGEPTTGPDQGAPMMRRTSEIPRRIQPARPATSDHGFAAFNCAACCINSSRRRFMRSGEPSSSALARTIARRNGNWTMTDSISTEAPRSPTPCAHRPASN